MCPIEMAAHRFERPRRRPYRIDPQNVLGHLFFARIVSAGVEQLQVDREVLVVVVGQAIRPGDFVQQVRGLLMLFPWSGFQHSPQKLETPNHQYYPKMG